MTFSAKTSREVRPAGTDRSESDSLPAYGDTRAARPRRAFWDREMPAPAEQIADIACEIEPRAAPTPRLQRDEMITTAAALTEH